jgi:hypothetical protein
VNSVEMAKLDWTLLIINILLWTFRKSCSSQRRIRPHRHLITNPRQQTSVVNSARNHIRKADAQDPKA